MTSAQFIFGGYLRLSRDEKNGNQESISIDNQRRILSDYAREKGWEIKKFYIDDGFTGTNFERPAFITMIEDIESGIINGVITKDLSRLGRNYSKIGYYTEEYFPEHNVRYIAISEGVDTLMDSNASNDMSPILNVFNEFYPREVSKKVRQVKRANAQKGMFMGSRAPFGYCKSPADKHKLIIDEEAAAIVRRIFTEFLLGENGRAIAQRLNQEGVICPRAYFYKKHGGENPKKENMTWCSATVLQVLDNPVYIGTLVQGKRQMISYKSKKRRLTNPNDWIIVENNHEPIIDLEVWETAKRIRQSRKYTHSKQNDYSQAFFSGLLECADCGAAMSPSFVGKSLKLTYRCGTYVSHGTSACASHSIREDVLEQIVLADIHAYAKLAVEERENLIKAILQYKLKEERSDTALLQKDIDLTEKKKAELKKTISCLYKDKALGKLPEDICFSMIQEYQEEMKSMEMKLDFLKSQLQEIQCTHNDVEQWTSLISSYIDTPRLDRNLVRALIQKITVSDKYMKDGEKTQDIFITYRFIGNLSSDSLNKKKNVA